MINAGAKWKQSFLNQSKDDNANIGSLDFNHDLSELAVCAGRRILVYRCSDGECLRQLKGHKDYLYTVSYSRSGDHLASGGADNCTIIWTKEGRGVLKFSHASSVQVVLYNPVEDILVSCAIEDFGFWTAEGKSVKKHKVESKIMAAAWRPDGQILAIGTISGEVLLTDPNGNNRGKVSRSFAISSLAWSRFDFNRNERNALIVGCWDKTIALFDAKLKHLSPGYEVDKYPLSLSLCGNFDEYMVVSTTGNSIYIYNQMGIVVTVLKVDINWVWYATGDFFEGKIACKNNKGEFLMLDVNNIPLSCSWNDSIAFIQCGTRVVVHNMENSQSTSFVCENTIDGLDIGCTHIVVQLDSKLLIYSMVNEPTNICSHICTIQIPYCFDVFALVNRKVVVAKDHRLILYNNHGVEKRIWILSANISSIKVINDVTGYECVLVGCLNGSVVNISLGNPFPVEIFKLEEEIEFISTSCNRRHIAVVDKKHQLHIYDRIDNKICERRESGDVSKVIFHDSVEGLHCFNSNGTIFVQHYDSMIKVSDCKGIIVKFKGSSIISIHKEAIIHTSVDLARIIEQKTKKASFDSALTIAELGVSSMVWKYLGYQSMLGLSLNVAETCFEYLGERSKISIIQRLKNSFQNYSRETLTLKSSTELVASEIDIDNGNFEEAGRRLISIGERKRAIEIFVSMGMFSNAQLAVSSEDKEAITRVRMKEARWEAGMNRWQNASELYLRCNSYVEAVEAASNISGDHRREQIYRIANIVPDDERDALNLCCNFLSQWSGNEDRLKELLIKMGDYSKLMALHIDNQAWIDVSNLRKEQEGNFDKTILIPYAIWLAAEGNLNEALDINKEAGQENRNLKLLSRLIKDATAQECYGRVSEMFMLASNIELDLIRDDSIDASPTNAFTDISHMTIDELKRLSILYYVYDQVNDYSSGTFSTSTPNNILQGCVFLINSISQSVVPEGISMKNLFVTFCKLARSLGGFYSARIGYEKLSRDLISEEEKQMLMEDMMTIEASPMEDEEDLLTVCFRCGSSQPLLQKDFCSTCRHPFIRCMINYDVLPLVEFKPKLADNLDESLVIEIIQSGMGSRKVDALFHNAINLTLTDLTESYTVVEIDREVLEHFDRADIYVMRFVQSKNCRYYRNMIPDIGIAVCHQCCQFFHEEDFEYHFLKEEGCPICKAQSITNVSNFYGQF